MKSKWKRLFASVLTALLICAAIPCPVLAENPATAEQPLIDVKEGSLSLNCRSAFLMEAETGTVLYTQNCEEPLPPASVTKIMTLLLVMEAIDAGTVRLDDTVTVSANAASMGGSQVYLKEGERMTVEEMLKSVVIASANDAAVALAEHLSGSVAAFVNQMNEKAQSLGMTSTHFENVTGLDDTAENHLTSAKDIALMSRELIRHKTILKYSSIWMDTIRDGAFGLTNTNRLVRFYQGCTGLKTGSTSKAGFCISVTAERNGMSLVCVIMGSGSRDERNAAAVSLLDWGFANYGVYRSEAGKTDPLRAVGGAESHFDAEYPSFSCVLPKADVGKVKQTLSLPECVPAPVKKGDAVGEVIYSVGEREIGKTEILASVTVDRIGFFEVWKRVVSKFLLI